MLDFTWTFVWTIVNILVLYWILKKLLFKPVTEFMDKRANHIKEMVDSAKENKELTENMKVELKKQLDQAVEEAQKIIDDAKVKAQKQYDEIINKSKVDAKQIADRMRAEIETERQNMLKELKNYISSIALAAATKVIQKNVDTADNKKLIDQFIDEVGAA
jgi:F-type H+-transporting ATPase subunit b